MSVDKTVENLHDENPKTTHLHHHKEGVMTTRILYGDPVTRYIYARIDEGVRELQDKGAVPKLVAVVVGDHPASAIYVGKKIEACKKHGIDSLCLRLPASVTQDELSREVVRLSESSDVHGIIVQMPLPAHLSLETTLRSLSPEKDVDGLHPMNAGRLMQLKKWPLSDEFDQMGFPVPCTPAGVMHLLAVYDIFVAGLHAVVVGRSTLVGKPLAAMLLAADATVTVCHTHTTHLASICREADILVATAGMPKFVLHSMVKPGSVVIDVGINRTDAGIVGDVDFGGAKDKASAITPVPGGVGPITVAMLLWNTVLLTKQKVR